MASKKKKAAAAAGGAAGAARKAKNSPYVQELVENDDLRDDIVEAYEAVRSAVDRLGSSKKPVTAIFDDKKLQNELKTAAENIRNSATALREAPSGGSKGGGLGRKLLLLVVAAGLALAISEDLRKKVLDALFGAEEEFEYTSTSSPSTSSGSSNGPANAASTETPAAS